MKKFWHGLNYLFCTLILILSLLILVFAIAGVSKSRQDASNILPVCFLMGIVLCCWERIITIKRRRHLCFKRIGILRPKYWLAWFLIFNLSWILSCSGIFYTIQKLAKEESIGTVGLFARILLIVFGCIYFLTLLTDIPFVGIRRYLRLLLRFIKNRVGVFLLYQLAFGVLSFLCSWIVIKLGQGTETGRMITAGFMFVANNETGTEGFDLNLGAILSSVTVASTYFGLSEIACDFLKDPTDTPFGKQLKGMLWDTDTKFLLIMTLLSLGSMFLAALNVSIMVKVLIVVAFIVGFGFSFISFIRQKFVMFLISITVMTLIETALPLPQWQGIGTLLGIVLCFALRTVLFSMIGLLNGFLSYVAEQMPGTMVGRVYNVQIEKIVLGGIAVVADPKGAAKAAVKSAVATISNPIDK